MSSSYEFPGSALVTGASSGIGAAIATALAGSGCRVILAARRVSALEKLKASLGNKVCAVQLDVTDGAAVAALPEKLPAGFEDVGILVNNAAHDVGGRTRFDSSTADELVSVIDTNLNGIIRVVRAFIPKMVARGTGDILNIGSVNMMRVSPGLAAYTASKNGLRGLTDVLRADFANTGIRVIEVVPGLTRTEFAQKRFRGDAEKAEAHFAKSQFQLQPSEIADAALYALTRPRHMNILQMVVAPRNHW
ncbi:MAG TPA: SDR family NAD(P)-dependent oxidoreductase [Pseudolabrys sp.]|jgi:NADP-dependent 3-hydroxy acid dehydrogenase YdfG|nr:SDR family NAD(P)-dependent oxidoreductase [Pseudolabrys sp.]